MDRRIKIGILAFAAVIALVAIGAVGAAADPSDTSSPPTSDWVFDEGKTTLIKSKIWTVRYNITVMNGSVLKFEDCTFTMNGTDPFMPMYILADVNSTIEIKNSNFKADEGSTGYFIETHDNTTITASEFHGLVSNPSGDGGIAIYGNHNVTANINFLEIANTTMANGLYIQNSQVDMSNCEIHDIDGNGIVLFVGDNEFNQWYNTTILDTEIHHIDGRALLMQAYTNYGHAVLDCYSVEVYNTTEEGIAIDVGDHSSSDNGNGSVYLDLDYIKIYDIGDQGIYLSHTYQQQGTGVVGGPLMNQFNVSLSNSTLYDVTNTGIYVQLYYTYVNYNMIVENVEFRDIALEPTFDRLGGIFYWYYNSNGGTTLYVGNSTFDRCEPSGFYGWDNGGNVFHFYNTTFVNNTYAGAVFDVPYSANQSPSLFENCTFHHNEGYGIRQDIEYMWQGSATPVHVSNSTFYRNGATALSCYGQDYNQNLGFNVSGCEIYDQDTLAIEVTGSWLKGAMILHITDTWINDTLGVKAGYNYDEWGGGASMDVLIINTTINHSKGTAVNLYGKGYYGSRLSVILLNSTVYDATGDGISINLGVASSWGNPQFHANILISNVTIEKVNGIALTTALDNPDMKGTREFFMNNTMIHTSQRGYFNLGFTGEMWNSEIKNTLKEDLFVIGARVDAYYNVFSNIAERKFKALEGGEIYFYWDMDIVVKWDTGAPAIGANVQVFDNKNTLISVQNVLREDGSLPTFHMNPYFVRETGIFGSTPYIINVSFLQVSRTVGIKLDSNKVVNIILEDHFEPEIFLLYPKQGHIQQSTTLQVRGSAWDSQSGIKEVLLSLDGDKWYPAVGKLRWNYTFEVEPELIQRFSGAFNLRAKAVDYADNEKVVFVQIRIDPTPPELNVDFPYDGYITNNPDLWVRGVTELGSTVEINSVPVPVVVSMFTHKVRLVEGPNTISVISIDPLGNIQIERMTVTLDTQLPYLILISPEEEGAMTNQPNITIEAQVEEGLTITINGAPADYEGGVMTHDQALEPGDNVVIIQARDKADNLLVIDRIVTYDTTEPWVQVISPRQRDSLPKPEVTIVGTVDPTATLSIDGEDVTVQNGYFERVILALEGENNVTLEATDTAGNVYTENLVFTVDTVDPEVTITNPEDDSVIVSERRFVIEGDFVDEGSGTGMVYLNGERYTYIDDGTGQVVRKDINELYVDENNHFAIPVDLLEGKNEYTVEVRDGVDNRATATRMMRLDTSAPTLVMYIDPINIKDDGTIVTNALTVNITGYTEPGSYLEINTIVIPVDDDGQFRTSLDMTRGTNTITLTSVDSADNERMINQTIEYQRFKSPEEETDFGLWFLVIALIILIAAAVFATIFVRGRREDWLEMEAAEATPLAPVDELETVVEEPDTLPGPEELEAEEEEAPSPEEEPAPTTAPTRPRPRSPQQRRAAKPRPVPKPKPKVEEKDLSEKDAEADAEADETDQEGI